MPTALEYALEYATQLGCYVFPIHAGYKGGAGKYHVASWAEASTNDPLLIREWGAKHPNCNWGLDCGKSDITVLDVDCKPGQQGWFNWQSLLTEHSQDTPWTRTHTTSGKGRHYLFRGAVRAKKELKKNVDLKATGGYVVLPGSHTIEMRNGNKYTQLEGTYIVAEPAPIEPLPDWIRNIAVQEVKPLEVGLEKDDLDQPHHVSEAIKYLLQTEPATEGAGGNNRTYEVATQVKDLGLAPQAAFDVMLDHFNPRCAPPWSPQELQRIIQNAFSYGQNPAGAKTPEAKLATAREEFTKVDLDSWPIPADAFDPGKAPPREWLIENWLPKGEISSLYGGGSAGKSLLTIQLGMSLASGKPWINLPVRKRCHVVGIYCEDSKDELHRRLDAIRQTVEYKDTAVTNFVLWPRVGKDNALVVVKKDDVIAGPFMAQLKTYLRSRKLSEHKLVILDTLSDIYMGDENTRERVNKCIKVHLASLAQDYNCTVLLLAHPSRTGLNTKDMLSGSTAWENAVRNRLAMIRDEDSEIVNLKRLKSNYARAGEEIPLIWEAGRFRPSRPGDAAIPAEAMDLSDYIAERYNAGDVMPVTDMVDRIANDPVVAHLFDGVTSSRRRIARLVDLLRAGVQTDKVEVKYEYRAEARVHHWLRIADREVDWMG